jgi:DNA-directed RNA polymerase subunit RPC12/RpoP
MSKILYLGPGAGFSKFHIAPEWAIGKQARCRDCGTKFVVEAGDRLYADNEHAGWQLADCPGCGSGAFVFKRWWNRLT